MVEANGAGERRAVPASNQPTARSEPSEPLRKWLNHAVLTSPQSIRVILFWAPMTARLPYQRTRVRPQRVRGGPNRLELAGPRDPWTGEVPAAGASRRRALALFGLWAALPSVRLRPFRALSRPNRATFGAPKPAWIGIAATSADFPFWAPMTARMPRRFDRAQALPQRGPGSAERARAPSSLGASWARGVAGESLAPCGLLGQRWRAPGASPFWRRSPRVRLAPLPFSGSPRAANP